MKKSYLLIGSLWDQMPIPEVFPACVPFDELVTEATEQNCIFDMASRRRFVRISKLLSCDTPEDLASIVSSLQECQTAYILLDYYPKSKNPTIVSFFKLRCLQIAHHISGRLGGSPVVFMLSPAALSTVRTKRLTLPWLIQIAERYIDIASVAGITFDELGFPLIPSECYAKSFPADLIDYPHRRSKHVMNPSSTAICFFMSDSLIYPRFERILQDVSEYRRFAGVVMPDITVTADMDLPWQALIMLFNQLFAAVLAINGIKIIANTRCGSLESSCYLKAIPKGVLCASGSLGCDRLTEPYDYTYTAKILQMRPSTLLVYGKRDAIAVEQLRTMGIETISYADSHSRAKKSLPPSSVAA